MTARLKLLTVSILLVVSACVSTGTKAITDAGIVSQIEVGKSTQADVAALLGYPITASYGGQGEETWYYTWVTMYPTAFAVCARGQSLCPLFGRNHPGIGRDLQRRRHREESGGEPATPEFGSLRLTWSGGDSGLPLLIPTIIFLRTQRKMKNGCCWWSGRPWPPLAGGHGGPPHQPTFI